MRMLWLIVLASAVAAGELKVSVNFEGGGGVVEAIDQETRTIRLRTTPLVNRGWTCWWYVRVNGIKPGETITIDVGEGFRDMGRPDRATFSTDQKTWRHTKKGARADNRIAWKQQIDAETAWFAWGPPFLTGHAATLTRELAAKHAFATAFTLAKTRGGREVPALRIAEGALPDADRPAVWIQARQHAWECGTSWVAKGVLEWIVGDTNEAQTLRRTAQVYVVPIMDMDSVADGAGGKSQIPHDHNRDWQSKPHWPAVTAAIDRITSLDKTAGLAVFLDLHSPGGTGHRHSYFFARHADLLSSLGNQRQEQFLALAKETITGELAFLGSVRRKRGGHISGNWVAENGSHDPVSLTLETPWNAPGSTTIGYRENGRQLAQTVARYLSSDVAKKAPPK